ncbi:MAG: hypothetical protein M3R31_13870 [Pseudomonadota bacterium]|nr:hypothetical protein [Pseudomonadota bacterium]
MNETLEQEKPAGNLSGLGLAEAALRDSEEKYRMLMDGVQDHAIFMLDPRGRARIKRRYSSRAADEIRLQHR